MRAKKIGISIFLSLVTILSILVSAILPLQNIAQAHTQQVVQTLVSEASCPKSPGMTEYIFYEEDKKEPSGWWGANGEPLVNREEVFLFCQHHGTITFEQKGKSIVVKWLIKPSKAYTINIYTGGKFLRKIRVSKIGMLDTTIPRNVVTKIDILN